MLIRQRRTAALLLAGGFLLQAAGCATAAVPIALSFAESALVSFFLTRIFNP